MVSLEQQQKYTVKYLFFIIVVLKYFNSYKIFKFSWRMNIIEDCIYAVICHNWAYAFSNMCKLRVPNCIKVFNFKEINLKKYLIYIWIHNKIIRPKRDFHNMFFLSFIGKTSVILNKAQFYFLIFTYKMIERKRRKFSFTRLRKNLKKNLNTLFFKCLEFGTP